MTKFSALLGLFFSVALSPIARAEEAPGLTCAMVPTLTQFLLRYHVSIHSANHDLLHKATDQMIKRLDPLFSAEEWGRAQLYTDPAAVGAFIADLKRAGVG